MKASIPSSLVFRVQIKLNSTIHRDAIALLHDLPKQNLAEVVALFLQYGAMAQRDINAGRCVFDAGAQAPTLKAVGSEAMPDTAQSNFTGAQGVSGLVPNPLQAAGFGMAMAADAFAIPVRPH